MKIGEIYSFVKPSGRGDDSRRHPFAVINMDGDLIECCMFTHSTPGNYPLNKPVSAEFFQKEFCSAGITPFEFDPNNPSYFLSIVLLKPSDYFRADMARVSGRLSPDGLAYIQKHVKDINPMSWQEYRKWARNQ